MPLAFWICAAVAIASAAVSFGYALVGLRQSPGAERTAASYAFARSLALLAVALIAPFTQSVEFVAAIAIAMVIVQLADAVVGARIPDRVKTFGPAATGLAGAATVVWMLVS